MRLDAYHYSFESTGNELVDELLSAIACAGKAYHHTERWGEKTEKYEEFHQGDSPVDWIQNSANKLVKHIETVATPLSEPTK